MNAKWRAGGPARSRTRETRERERGDLGEAPEGIFTYELSTDGIAAGQYILAVELDGEAQAARIVKLNDQ